jgi:hypothetical protein
MILEPLFIRRRVQSALAGLAMSSRIYAPLYSGAALYPKSPPFGGGALGQESGPFLTKNAAFLTKNAAFLTKNTVVLPKNAVVLPKNAAVLTKNTAVLPTNTAFLPEFAVIYE